MIVMIIIVVMVVMVTKVIRDKMVIMVALLSVTRDGELKVWRNQQTQSPKHSFIKLLLNH